MGLLDMLRIRKKRERPPREDWPDSVVPLDNGTFTLFIEKYPLSIVDFWAPWCSPCNTLSPRIKRLSKMYNGKVAFGKLNIQQHKDIADRYQILSIPYLAFFSYGKKVASLVGVKSIVDMKQKINSMLKKFES